MCIVSLVPRGSMQACLEIDLWWLRIAWAALWHLVLAVSSGEDSSS